MKDDPGVFEETISPNSIPIYFKRIPWIEGWFEIRVLVGGGARLDPIGKEGLAHFLEHLPFNGIPAHPTAEIVTEMKRRIFFNTLNAFTSFDGVIFHGKTSKKNLHESAAIFRELIFYPLLQENEIERERRVIIQEIRNDFPMRRTAEITRDRLREVYQDHCMGRMSKSYGWEDAVEKISREDLVSHHHQYYHPGNIQLVFAGDVSRGDVLRWTDIFSSDVSKEKSTLPPAPILVKWPGPNEPEILISWKEYWGTDDDQLSSSVKIAFIQLERPFPKLQNVQQLIVAEEMLSELLFREIRRKIGACYSIDSNVSKLRDACRLKLTVSIDPIKANEAKEIAKRVIMGFETDEYEDIFRGIQSHLIEKLKVSDNNVDGIADNAVYSLMNAGRIVSNGEILDKRAQVTYSDVVKLVTEELSPDLLAWFIIVP